MKPTPDFSKLYAVLHNAVCHKFLDELRSVLTSIPESVVAQLKYDGKTHTAIINAATVRRYYQLHNRLDCDGTTEVLAGSDLARRKQDFEAVKLLLDHGFSPQDIGPGEDDYGPGTISPVQLSAETDDHEVVQLLLDAGADPKSHYRDITGPSSPFDLLGPPLQSAVVNGSLTTLQCLIAWSKQHSDRFPLSEDDKGDALIASVYHVFAGTFQIIYFLEGYIEPRFECRSGALPQVEIVQTLLEAGADPNHITGQGHGMLSEATRIAKGPEIVRLLIDHAARVDQAEKALSHSALRNGTTELVRTFLDLGLIPSQLTAETIPCTPLHLVAVHAPADTLKLLVSAGFDPSAKDANGLNPDAVTESTPDGWSPLTIGYKTDARYYGKGAPYMVEQGADFNATTPELPRYTPVHIAAKWGYWDLLELLLHRGALITKAEATNESALHFMDWDDEGHSGTKSLLKHGADINAQDNEGATLLHKLFKVDPRTYYEDIVEFLLKSGADLSVKDNQGKTPMEWNDELPEFRRWKGSD
ncbi:ankyrin repeat-containing domain protein [Aspergillus terricola var. indicus]